MSARKGLGPAGCPPGMPMSQPYGQAPCQASESVGDRPGGFIHTGTPTHETRRAGILRLERQETDGRLGLRFHLGLALRVTAPRATHEPAAVGDQLLQLVEARRPVGVRIAERDRVVEQALLQRIEQPFDRPVGSIEPELLLLAGVPPRDRDLVRLEVAEPEVEPNRDPTEFAVCGLVPGPQVVTIVDLD